MKAVSLRNENGATRRRWQTAAAYSGPLGLNQWPIGRPRDLEMPGPNACRTSSNSISASSQRANIQSSFVWAVKP